jgi:hypothetical protein
MVTATENNKYCSGGKGLMDRRMGHVTGGAAQLISRFAWPTLITILFGMAFRWMSPGSCLHAPVRD